MKVVQLRKHLAETTVLFSSINLLIIMANVNDQIYLRFPCFGFYFTVSGPRRKKRRIE